MSTFDVNSFLDLVFDTPSETESIPCPAGEYQAQVVKLDVGTWKGKEDPTKHGVKLDIQWEILDETARDVTKRDKVIVRSSVMFNIVKNAQGLDVLDMEKALSDVRFGRLRAAIGLNDGPFSPGQLMGQFAKVRVTHRIHEGVTYAEVKDYAPMN